MLSQVLAHFVHAAKQAFLVWHRHFASELWLVQVVLPVVVKTLVILGWIHLGLILVPKSEMLPVISFDRDLALNCHRIVVLIDLCREGVAIRLIWVLRILR